VSILIPPRTPHNALDIGPETGQMLSTYIVEVGPPLATFINPRCVVSPLVEVIGAERR
jgi:hypothetical protein